MRAAVNRNESVEEIDAALSLFFFFFQILLEALSARVGDLARPG